MISKMLSTSGINFYLFILVLRFDGLKRHLQPKLKLRNLIGRYFNEERESEYVLIVKT